MKERLHFLPKWRMRSHGIWKIIAGRDWPGPVVWPAWPGNSGCTNSVFLLHGEGPPIADPRCTVLCHCVGEDENTNTSQLRNVRSWRVFFAGTLYFSVNKPDALAR